MTKAYVFHHLISWLRVKCHSATHHRQSHRHGRFLINDAVWSAVVLQSSCISAADSSGLSHTVLSTILHYPAKVHSVLLRSLHERAPSASRLSSKSNLAAQPRADQRQTQTKTNTGVASLRFASRYWPMPHENPTLSAFDTFRARELNACDCAGVCDSDFDCGSGGPDSAGNRPLFASPEAAPARPKAKPTALPFLGAGAGAGAKARPGVVVVVVVV
jgi:hypothetical protein